MNEGDWVDWLAVAVGILGVVGYLWLITMDFREERRRYKEWRKDDDEWWAGRRNHE